MQGPPGAGGPAGPPGRDGCCSCDGGGGGGGGGGAGATGPTGPKGDGSSVTWGLTDASGTRYTNINTVLFDASAGFSMTKPTETSLLIDMNMSTTTTSNDPWTFTNLIDAPPAITFGTPVTQDQFVYIPWSYPPQINVGFMNIYLPAINTLSCTWTGNVSGNMVSNQPILTDVSGDNFIKYNKLVANGTYITGVVLTNANINIGYQTKQFPQDPTGVLRKTYVYYSPSFANLKRDVSENRLTAWYGNYSLNSNKSYVIFDGSMTPIVIIGPPSAPGVPTFGAQSNTSYKVSFDVSCAVPTYVNTLNHADTETTIQNYKYTYSTPGSALRYGGVIADTSKNVIGQNTSSIRNLYPDCSYTFYAAAQNSGVETYSDLSPTSVIYTKYLNPISFGSLSFPSPGTTYSAKLVGNNNSGDLADATVNNILLSLPTLPWTSSNITSPIHAVINRGSADSNLLRIRGNVVRGSTEIETSDLLYAGFPATKPSNVVTNNVTITSSTPVDTYADVSAGYQGFYLQVNTTISVKTGIFTESNNKTVINVEQYQNSNSKTTGNYSFYYEQLGNAPTVNAFDISLNTANTFHISGILALYGSAILNATTTASTMGKFFYNKDRILTYSSGQNELGLTNVTAGSRTSTELNSTITIVNTGSPSIVYSNTSFTKDISMTAIAYNPKTYSNPSSIATVSTIFDQPSYNMITTPGVYPVTVPLVGNAVAGDSSFINLANVVGCRIWTGVSSNVIVNSQPANVINLPPSLIYANVIYNHSWDITSTTNEGTYDATQEIQIFNGSYNSKGTTTNGYIDYTSYYISSSGFNTLDYSTIEGTGYRFATFCWKCNNTGTTNIQYTNIVFKMNGIAQTITMPGPSYAPLVNGVPIYFYYRSEDADNYQTFSASYKNSVWVDACSSNNKVSAGTYWNINGQIYASGTILGGKSAVVNTFANGTLTVNANMPATTFNVSSSKNYNIYLRIGLPMSVDMGFTNIQCSIY